jgi:hypothetical protein
MRKFEAWADFAHQQYCSVLCIALGAWLGNSISTGRHSPNRHLIIIAVLLFLAGLVSDLRLRTVHESFPPTRPLQGNTQVSQNNQAQLTEQAMTPQPAAAGNTAESKVS